MKEGQGENIFAWKQELRGLSREERAKWFYNKKLIPSLSDDVTQAEIARQQGEHGRVREVYSHWSSQAEARLKKLESRQESLGVDLSPKRDLLKVGFAGLGRIRHVDTNSQLKRAESQDKDTLLSQIDEVKKLYDLLGLGTLVPWTIHGGPIHWFSEVAQDEVNTQKILGDEEKASLILNKAVEGTEGVIESLRERHNIPDLLQKEDDELGYEDKVAKELYLGSVSALGVLWARRAKMSLDLKDFDKSLTYLFESTHFDHNYHRLATVSTWALVASFTPSFRGSFADRFKLALRSSRGIFTAFRGSPKDTLSAVRQFVRGK
jgi:hypothetical protein